MLHQPSGAIGGQATDIAITAREIRKIKQELYEIISQHSGQPMERVHVDCDRDFWMTAEEAKAYGIVDEVLLKNTRKDKTSDLL
jgi:ATP-dependent Clp protease protease subunit